jgi:hypothetical protein
LSQSHISNISIHYFPNAFFATNKFFRHGKLDSHDGWICNFCFDSTIIDLKIEKPKTVSYSIVQNVSAITKFNSFHDVFKDLVDTTLKISFESKISKLKKEILFQNDENLLLSTKLFDLNNNFDLLLAQLNDKNEKLNKSNLENKILKKKIEYFEANHNNILNKLKKNLFETFKIILNKKIETMTNTNNNSRDENNKNDNNNSIYSVISLENTFSIHKIQYSLLFGIFIFIILTYFFRFFNFRLFEKKQEKLFEKKQEKQRKQECEISEQIKYTNSYQEKNVKILKEIETENNININGNNRFDDDNDNDDMNTNNNYNDNNFQNINNNTQKYNNYSNNDSYTNNIINNINNNNNNSFENINSYFSNFFMLPNHFQVANDLKNKENNNVVNNDDYINNKNNSDNNKDNNTNDNNINHNNNNNNNNINNNIKNNSKQNTLFKSNDDNKIIKTLMYEHQVISIPINDCNNVNNIITNNIINNSILSNDKSSRNNDVEIVFFKENFITKKNKNFDFVTYIIYLIFTVSYFFIDIFILYMKFFFVSFFFNVFNIFF